jgi:predicted metal-binding protein
MHLEYAKDPRWANAEHTMIDLTARFAEIPEELPFTASPEDCEAHGRAIFTAATAGEYGAIAEFVPYVPTKEEKAETIRAERDALLAASDWTQLPDVPDATRSAWAVYRQALRDITQQAGFPDAVVWPTKPA